MTAARPSEAGRDRRHQRAYEHVPGFADGYGQGFAEGCDSEAESDPALPDQADGDSVCWYDDDAGPLVRLYALTRGRARSDARVFNLLSLVIAQSGPYDDPTLSPEQVRILGLCRCAPQSVAEIAACCDVPVGVARVLLGDLLEIGHIRVRQPKPPAALFDERILQEVIDGLRAL